MSYMNYTNPNSPRWGNAVHTVINIMVTFVDLPDGEVEFTAASWDTEEHGVELFQLALNGDFGEIAKYVEPPKSIELLIAEENAWRIKEVAFITDQLIGIEDGDPTALPGTDVEWRAYRTKVRAWKEGTLYFPDSTQRPIRPS